MIAQRSPTPFSIGVPVRARRQSDGSLRAARDLRVSAFLMFCASSIVTTPQCTELTDEKSRQRSW